VLEACHAIPEVVHTKHIDVKTVAAQSQEMISANTQNISIATHDRDVQVGISQLDPKRRGYCPAMG